MAPTATDTRDSIVPTDTFSARLVLLRHELGLSQLEISKRCGLDDGSWSNWERGAQPRKILDVITKIVRATGVDREWLLWGGPLREQPLDPDPPPNVESLCFSGGQRARRWGEHRPVRNRALAAVA